MRTDPKVSSHHRFVENTSKLKGNRPHIFHCPPGEAASPGVVGSPRFTMTILIMSRKKAKEKNLPVPGEIVVSLTSATTPRYIATIPPKCLKLALEKTGITLYDIDLIEINEAFAAVVLTRTKILAGGDEKKWQKILAKTNVNGGAIAIGHPVGASALRLTMTMLPELRRRGGKRHPASCGGKRVYLLDRFHPAEAAGAHRPAPRATSRWSIVIYDPKPFMVASMPG
jgi:hypothetical protein